MPLGSNTYPDGLDSNDLTVLLPDSLVDLSILTTPQLVPHGNVRPLDLPLIWLWRDAVDGWLVCLGSGEAQGGYQAIGILAMVVDQFGHTAELALVGDIDLEPKVENTKGSVILGSKLNEWKGFTRPFHQVCMHAY